MRDAISSIVKTISGLLPRKNHRSERLTEARDGNAKASSITILCVPGTDPDRQLLDEISRRNHWNMSFASSSDEARESLKRSRPQIILIDRDIDGADWRYAVSSLAAASGGACVLLISRVIDDYLWNEVVTNGGYDVLRKPLSESEVLRNVKLAWSYWSGTRPAGAASKKSLP
jgi:DNA-binding response OmpR family regulator